MNPAPMARNLTTALLLACLASLAASCRVYTDRTGTVYVEPATVQVPSLIGLDANAATRTLQSYQLLSGQVRYSAPTAIPQFVVAQNPAPGAVVSVRSYVSYTLAPSQEDPQPQPQPPAQSRVPALSGQTQDQARATLASVGLSLGSITWGHSDAPSGVVISHNPAAGMVVAQGSQVSVALSSGPAPLPTVLVPGLVNQTFESAQAQILRSGLLVGSVRYEQTRRHRAGTVIAQDPPAGAEVNPGTQVDFVVAIEREQTTAIVPSIVGMTFQEALDTLSQAGLSQGEISTVPVPHPQAERVISQALAPNTRVQRGTQVAFTIGQVPAQPAMVIVPRLTGLTIDHAQNVLAGVGLTMGRLGQQETAQGVGLIISQTPSENTSVAPGTAVSLIVGVATPGTPAPDVSNMTYVEAVRAITTAGLVVGEVRHIRSNPRQAGKVISMSPPAGTRLPPGSRISMEIGQISGQPGTVILPRLTGLELSQAEELLASLGLGIGSLGQQESIEGAGSVLSQNPAENTRVARGSLVNIIVGVAPAGVAVPNVIGLTQDAAARAIMAAGLVVGETRQIRSHPRERGKVIDQSPQAGVRADPGTRVNFDVAAGAVMPVIQVQVPNVTGMTQQDATRTILEAGLVVGEVREVLSHPRNAWKVVAQTPNAGTQALAGSSVSLDIGFLPQPVPVAVPRLVGLTLDQAQAALSGAGLVLGSVGRQESRDVGMVLSQDPQHDARVARGSAVSVVVGVAPAGVAVPTVIGLTQDAATRAIMAAGLVVGEIRQIASHPRERGKVIDQSPQAGVRAAPGTRVNFDVAAGAVMPVIQVQVPNVMGMTQPNATRAIVAAGLVVGEVREILSQPQNAQKVVAQTPNAGTQALAGSSVSLDIGVVSPQQLLVNVPKLAGLTLDQAQAAISGAGLVLGSVGRQESRDVGLVLSQNPQHNAKAARGSAVNVVVGAAPAGLQVPQVVGLTQDAAVRALTAAGLRLGAVTRQDPGHGSIPNNTVLDQTPDAGAIAVPGSAVNIVVCWHERRQVKVPQLRGKDYNRAVTELAEVGLAVGRVERRPSNRGQAGKVLDQDPAHNSMVWTGTAINITIGEFEKAVELVLVPLLAGLTEAEALKALKDADLKANVVKVVGIPRGRVLLQLPLPGTPVEKGSTVTIHVPR